jgi:hypothetical protein
MAGGHVHPVFDLAYRIVAIALCISFGRQVWHGLIERKITLFNTDLLDWWTPSQVFHRDAAPVRYWIVVGTQTFTTVLCFVAAIIGWWQPNA